ncbi:MAG: ABC transporter permease [Bryobacteraceae bacterium]
MQNPFRGLQRNPGFTLFAVATLALGIGVTTAMFSVVNRILLQPIPYADPQRVVALNTKWTDTGRQTPRLSGPDWSDLAAATDVFETVARYHGGEIGVQLRDKAEFAGTYLVTPNYFAVFGVAPLVGRLPVEANANRAAAVSSAFAERAFGAARQAVGQSIRVDGQSYEVISVMPPGFRFPSKADVWLVVQTAPENHHRSAHNYSALAKLKTGVAIGTAQARLDALGLQIAAAEPATNATKRFTAIPLQEQLVGNSRSTILLLMAAVLLVLLITCANVAHLLLARSAAQARDFAVRAALGASRARIFADALAESVALGALGCLLGVMFAQCGVYALVWLAPANLPRMDEVRVDGTVLAFGVALSFASAVIFGLAPAWQTTRIDVQEGLRQAGARGLVGVTGTALRNGLVIAEIAFSFALAIGAGLLFRSFLELNSVPLGFRTEGVLVVYAHAPSSTMKQMLATTRFFESLLADLQQVPGAISVAAAMGLPTGRYNSNGLYFIEGKDLSPQHAPNAGLRLASAQYFSTLGIPIRKGRDFNAGDQYEAPFVAIVSESLARRSFPNEDPIGKRIQCGLDSPKWMTIVGVVGDVRASSPASAPGPELYMPFQQHPIMANELQLAIRTAVNPASLQNAVQRKIRQLNPTVAIRSTTMETMVADSVATPRFRTFLVTIFAAVALLLSMSGVYGLMSYLVTRRTSEMGVRMALGATPADIVLLILRRAALLAVAGLVAGLVIATSASKLLESMLFGLTHTDTLTYAIAAAALALVTLLAAALPAYRAARIDPATALRE